MTLILCYAEEPGIRLLGDSGRNLGGVGSLPTVTPPAPKKVQRCPRATIAGALYGDLPIQHNGNFYQPDVWLEAFFATEIEQNSPLDRAVDKLLRSLQRATFCGPTIGGIILAGFVERKPAVYEIEAKPDLAQKVSYFTPRAINEAELKAYPIVRGLNVQSWDQVQALCGCGPLTAESYRATYLSAVRALSSMGQPVAEPVTDVFIEPTPFHRPNFQTPVPGSFEHPPSNAA